jgi:hypothetical protein
LAVAASIVATLLFTGSATLVASDAAARKIRLGIVDSVYKSADANERREWLDRTVGVGARVVRLGVNWRATASNRQPPANPTDPADPTYDWDDLDAAVRDAVARGLQVKLAIRSAPSWAEGPGRDPAAPAGTWKPDPGKLGAFSQAIATRYSGAYGGLPRVSLWEIWGEPGSEHQLNPLRKSGGKKSRLFAPGHFRKMVNAASKKIHKVNGSNQVIAGTTAPYGNDSTIAPLIFWRDFFCLKGRKLRPKRCPGGKARVDGFGSNPLGGLFGLPPDSRPASSNDILIPEMRRLKKIVRAAGKHHRVKPRKGTDVIAGELLWESNPPDPNAGSLANQASFLTEAVGLLRKQGVSEVDWVRIRDDPPNPTFRYPSLQSGLFFRDGKAKPAAQAFAAAAGK